MKHGTLTMTDILLTDLNEGVEVEWNPKRGVLYVNVNGVCALRIKVLNKDQVTITEDK